MSYQHVLENPYGISLSEIKREIPAIFANHPRQESVSAKYQFISSLEVLEALIAEGFIVTTAMQSRAQAKDDLQYAKHLFRVRRTEDRGRNKDLIAEGVLVNGHRANSTLQVWAGLLRTLCANGMIVFQKGAQELRIRHSGNVGDVIAGSVRVIEEGKQGVEQMRQWSGVEVSAQEQLLLATFALIARYGVEAVEGASDVLRLGTPASELPLEGEVTEITEEPSILYKPAQFLVPRRSADRGDTLDVVVSRVQENVVRGGVPVADKKGKVRKTRAIGGVTPLIETNKLLWQFTQALADSKKGN